MLQMIKDHIQNTLLKRAFAQYEKEIERQSDSYTQWIRENEGIQALHNHGYEDTVLSERGESYIRRKISVVPYEVCVPGFSVNEIHKEYVVFAAQTGTLRSCALLQIAETFAEQPDAMLLYGDEDWYQDNTTGKRIEPWFKPSWSPDTLMSFFYFGSVFAVRTQVLQEQGADWCIDTDSSVNLYRLALLITEKLQPQAIHHCDGIWYHNNSSVQPPIWGMTKRYYEMKQQVLLQRGIVTTVAVDAELTQEPQSASGARVESHHSWKEAKPSECCPYMPIYLVEKQPLVSIVIPSKDHPDVLQRCLHSVINHTCYPNYEIIIVDNGSNAEHKKEMERLQTEYGFQYLYHPMDFNFSTMCNLGVAKAQGEYILLLNDDCEMIQSDWLERMLGQASLAHVGAVGAKLLYPDNHLIQHAGITNLAVGPAHKLNQLSDEGTYYYGQNKLIYDMIGVTAACLLIAKEKYQAVHGFSEELAVSYNDVDFCFSLLEHGWYNVQRNDVVLYHHESLSRGEDGEDAAKWIRLLSEKQHLFDRHPQFYQYDPYYSKYLVTNAREYRCNYLYTFEQKEYPTQLKRCRWSLAQLQSYRNESLCVTIEHAAKEVKLELEEPTVYLIAGWSHLLGTDNGHYKRKLLLIAESGQIWTASVIDRYREDVVRTFPQETHLDLAGFVCRIPAGILARGHYQLALLTDDRCSRQRLYTITDASLFVE
ncbi:MAG: glycosyltransferase [Lachnospiraceae bacterium]